MPRLVTFVDNELLKNLQQMAKDRDINVSKMASKLIETGYKVEQLQRGKSGENEAKKMEELRDKHSEYLLRILATTADILRCVHNDKSKYIDKDPEVVITKITENMQEYVRGFIGKDQ